MRDSMHAAKPETEKAARPAQLPTNRFNRGIASLKDGFVVGPGKEVE